MFDNIFVCFLFLSLTRSFCEKFPFNLANTLIFLVNQVLELEGKDKGEWGFKALKQMIKINFKLVSIGDIASIIPLQLLVVIYWFFGTACCLDLTRCVQSFY